MTTRTMLTIRAAQARILAREDGFASSTILAVATVLLVLAALQAGAWYMGTTIAQNAATSGYTVARAYQSTQDAGSAAANQIIRGASGYLQDSHVDVQRTPTMVTITVTGRPVSLLPGVTLPEISRSATGPVERWVPAP